MPNELALSHLLFPWSSLPSHDERVNVVHDQNQSLEELLNSPLTAKALIYHLRYDLTFVPELPRVAKKDFLGHHSFRILSQSINSNNPLFPIFRLSLKIQDLRASGQLTDRHFQPTLRSLSQLSSRLAADIRQGLILYLDEDWLAATYLLVPLTEELARKIVQLHRSPTFEVTKNGVNYKPIGRFSIYLKQLLPRQVFDYFIWSLKDPAGLNLRNLIAHGLLRSEHLNPTIPTLVIHLICLLTHYGKGSRS